MTCPNTKKLYFIPRTNFYIFFPLLLFFFLIEIHLHTHKHTHKKTVISHFTSIAKKYMITLIFFHSINKFPSGFVFQLKTRSYRDIFPCKKFFFFYSTNTKTFFFFLLLFFSLNSIVNVTSA